VTSVPRLLAMVPLVVVCALGLGGCRGGGPTALPAASTPAAPRAAAVAPADDPLAGIESEVAAVERDVDVDARSDAGSAPGPAPRR